MNPKTLLIFLILIGLLLRFNNLLLTPFFTDQDWYFHQASTSVLTGHFPLVGITSSIRWLHQGPLWSYLLIPGLLLSGFHPLSGAILTNYFGLVAIPLSYYLGTLLANRKNGLILASLMALTGFSINNSRLSYHTSPIPLFTIIFLLTLIKKKHFLSGIFLGFLYQLHLLTFIFWPFVMLFFTKNNLQVGKLLLGFLLGILPFIIFGPIQTFGAFAWVAKFLVGLSQSSGISEAYQVVLFTPIIILLSLMLSKLNTLVSILTLLLIIIVSQFLYQPYSPSLTTALTNLNCQNFSSTYLYWWKCEHN